MSTSDAEFLEPDELFLEPNERAALILVLEKLESGKLEHVDVAEIALIRTTRVADPDAPILFNMTAWMMHAPECGTVACVGGAAQAYAGVNLCDASEIIAREQGTEDHGLHDLLYGTHHGATPLVSLNAYGAMDAAAGIRNYLRTGWPDWPQVFGARWVS